MRNVVLVCVDSVRKDAADRYAPRLRARADLDVPQARAASSWSVPSHASMFTGTLPHRHGVHTYDRDYSTLSRAETFLGDLPGHRALGVSANVFASEAFGFDTLFDSFHSVSNATAFPGGLDVGDFVAEDDIDHPMAAFLLESLRSPNRLQSLANGGLALFDDVATGRRLPNVLDNGGRAVLRQCRRSVARSEEPFVLFCNLMEAHTPLTPLAGFDSAIADVPATYTTATQDVWSLMGTTDDHAAYCRHWRALYAAAIDYLDRHLAAFLDWLEAHTDRETTVVVTADHGENFGYPEEDGLVRHKSSLSEGLLHVPLLVVNPPEGVTIDTDGYVSHLELGSLVTALATESDCDPTRERVPAEVLGLSAGPEPPADRRYWDRTIRCAYRGGTKFCWDSLGTARRFSLDPDLPSFQAEVDAEATVPRWARALFETDIETAAETAAAESEETGVSAATKDRLEQLGYR